ncbi:CDI toxin immunity protein [Bacillus changyiensis]|uniref:CDI toxin immunity protein n=1 Tax=Bacillus changyiensis TaxID=3004103 RepID=UPI0022E939B7|nr:hypothetical protein [Bacillus changyiensis]MDA1477756.1 hypothetical protein [Bacillus changyiensis]
MSNHAKVYTVDEIITFLKRNSYQYSHIVYISWDEGTLTINLDQVLEVIDDVTAVSFDTWIFSPLSRCVIEIFHDGEVKIGSLIA